MAPSVEPKSGEKESTIEPAVLEDATGRRRRRMRLLGRAVSLLFLLWLVVIVLGGIGVAPVGHVPLVRVLRPSGGPPAVRTLPAPRPPAPADLRPALPAAALPAPRARGRPLPAHPPGRSSLAPGHNKTGSVRGRSSLAPGHTKRTPRGRSSSAPGHVKTTIRGRSSSVPGQLKTTTRGRSSSAPGQMKTTTGATGATTTTRRRRP